MAVLSLPQFIESIGDDAASRLFEAELRTVQSWRRRERYPRPETAQRMVAVSNGHLTMDSIYAAVPCGDVGADPDIGRIEPLAELP